MTLPQPPTDSTPVTPLPSTPLPSRPAPSSLWDLFWSFNWLALQGFGGVLAIVHREIVEKKGWVTSEEFIEEWAVAQIMPGPNVVNFSLMVGARYFGLRGAMAALAGILLIPLVIILALGIVYVQFSNHPGVSGAIRGMGAVAAGLIISTGLKLAASLRTHPLGSVLCSVIVVLCFVIIALLHWPLLFVLASIGSCVCVLTYRALKK